MRGRRQIAPSPALCPEGVSVATRTGLDAFPAPRGTLWVGPASIHSIGLRASTVLCTLRTPCCHLPPLLARLVRHTRTGMIGLPDASKNFRASLVALTTCCVARMGLRLRVSDHRSPGRGTGVAFRHEHTLGRIRQIQRFRSSIPFRAGELSPYLSSSLPFCVRFNQRLRRNRLIRWLQHSIPGLWLAATRAGFHPLVLKPFPVRTSIPLFGSMPILYQLERRCDLAGRTAIQTSIVS